MPTFPTTSFPQDSDIQSFVTAAGVVVPTSYTFSGMGAKARREWERATGRTPFIASGSQVQRAFDPPGSSPCSTSDNQGFGGGRMLPIPPGIVSCASVVSMGASLVFGVGYRLLPLDAPFKNQPYDMMEFYFPQYGPASSVLITADWGYWDSIDEDVWYGVCRLGASLVAKDILEGVFSTPSLIQIGEDKIQQDSFRELGDSWAAQAARDAAYYSFKNVGL
jgi:hypothetical protein